MMEYVYLIRLIGSSKVIAVATTIVIAEMYITNMSGNGTTKADYAIQPVRLIK